MEHNHSKLTALGVLAVFLLLTVSILGVLLTGAEGYGALVARGEAAFSQRTAAQYLTTRVRQADRAGAVTVADFGGGSALVIRESVSGRDYVTRVYCHDGWLRELFTPAAGDFSPEDGEKLLELEALTLSLNDGLLTGVLTLPDGQTQRLTLLLRSEQEVAP